MTSKALLPSEDISGQVFAWLDRFYKQDHLSGDDIVLAVSGGADSMAMLHLVLEWRAERRLTLRVHAVIIDHALRAGSKNEAQEAVKRVQAMGANAHIRTWTHKGVKTAIQERARIARYDLLAQGCAELGADRLLVGHTQDDQAETIAMRKDSGASWRGLAGIADQITAPLWPYTRGLTIGRPLLTCSRVDIRRYCTRHKIKFHDDPSNENTDFQRVRVRAALMQDPQRRSEMLALGAQMRMRRRQEDISVRAWLSRWVKLSVHGGATVPRGALAHMPLAALADVLRYIGGQSYRPDMERVEALCAHINAPEFTARTLGGSVVYAAKGYIGFARDPGGVLGRRGAPPKPLALAPNHMAVWDNRFEAQTPFSGLILAPLWPARGQLDLGARSALDQVPAPERRALAGFFRREQLVAAPSVNFFTQKKSLFYLNYIGFMRF